MNTPEESWIYSLDILKIFIRENNRRPFVKSRNEDETKLGVWLSHQLKNYKKRTQIMENNDIYQLFQEFLENDEFKEYFMSNEESWLRQLDELKHFIRENNRRPLDRLENGDERKLRRWLSNQLKNYRERTQIMKNDDIYQLFQEFLENDEFNPYFS